MDAKVFSEIARYEADKHVHVPVFNGERTKVLLLCLSGGLSVPPHSHPGFEVTLQPLLGRAVLPGEDGKELLLEPGRLYFVDGALSFNPRNPYAEPFQMLIHLVKR
jgi:quercetin dioxygenase-like cupin family protein